MEIIMKIMDRIKEIGDSKFANGLAIIIGISAVIILPFIWWFWEQIPEIMILILIIIVPALIFLYYAKKTSEMPIILIGEVEKPISLKPVEYFPFPDQGCITNPANFFGRELLLKNIFANLTIGSNLSLIGESKVGKSSLLYHVCRVGPRELGWPKENFIYLDMQNISDENDFFKALCAEIGIKNTNGSELNRELKGKHIILCIDEIEKMTSNKFSGEERTQLSGLAGGSALPLTLLIASRSSLEELFPDSPLMTSPLANVCERIYIKPFSDLEVKNFIVARLKSTKKQFSDEEIANICEQSKGHPAEVQRLAKRLYQEKNNLSESGFAGFKDLQD